jgi:hypothetical protein
MTAFDCSSRQNGRVYRRHAETARSDAPIPVGSRRARVAYSTNREHNPHCQAETDRRPLDENRHTMAYLINFSLNHLIRLLIGEYIAHRSKNGRFRK